MFSSTSVAVSKRLVDDCTVDFLEDVMGEDGWKPWVDCIKPTRAKIKSNFIF